MYDYLVVGAGLFGSTFAWYARQAGKSVLVVESRHHIGGNCYTEEVEGISVHVHGPHIFHTSDEKVWRFINRFASFNGYVHRVKAVGPNDRVYSMPINLATMNSLWGVATPEAAREVLKAVAVPMTSPKNMEEWAISQVGLELYRLLIEGYTMKQWGRHPSELPASILWRLPIRTSWDDNYFTDTYQGIPIGGYTQIFERLLEGCDVRLGVDYLADRAQLEPLASKVVYTGPIDAYFDHSLGHLEYRSLSFRRRVIDTVDYQGLAQMNYTSTAVPWTRVIEHKHFDPRPVSKTVVTWETPEKWVPGRAPYYPVNDSTNNATYFKYRDMAENEPKTVFGGRLGTYKYFDMHQIIAQAMHLAKKEGL